MKAVIFNSPGNMAVIEKEMPVIKDDELLIKVEYCGVCGTDFQIYEGKAPAVNGIVPGHEYAGEIVEIGKMVKGYELGEMIAVNPNIHCGYCDYCRTGRIHLCRNLKALGVTTDGGFAEYSAVPVTQAFKFPNSFPAQSAAFAEPVSCCLHGIERADIKINDSVVIIGAGAIGLIILQLAKLRGAAKVIVVEKEIRKRETALKLNADAVIDPSDVAYFEIVNEKTSGGADIVIECAGNEEAANLAIKTAAAGATVVIFGLSSAQAIMQTGLQEMFHKELTIKTSLLNPYTFKTALDLLVSGKVNTNLFNIKYLPVEEDSIKKLFGSQKEKDIQKFMISNKQLFN